MFSVRDFALTWAFLNVSPENTLDANSQLPALGLREFGPVPFIVGGLFSYLQNRKAEMGS